MTGRLCAPCTQIEVNDRSTIWPEEISHADSEQSDHIRDHRRRLSLLKIWPQVRDHGDSGQVDPVLKHHQNLLELKICAKSSQDGCPVCRVLWAAVKEQRPPDLVQHYLNNWDTDEDLKETVLGLDTRLTPMPQESLLAGEIEHSFEICIHDTLDILGRVSVFALPGSAPEHTLRGRNVKEFEESQDRNRVVSITKEWLDECESSHPRCRTKSQLPSRIVYIGGPEPIVIETKPGDTDRYMALSYCWGEGKDSMIMFDEKNRDKLLHGEIKYSDLVMTHQEGIRVARELGVDYIWIDALCIDQDKWEDWEEQSLRVPDIYGNAFLTIVAGRSSDSRYGFLKPTYKPSVEAAQLPYGSPSALKDNHFWVGLPRNREIGPADKRAWCFQESLVARRMIIYGEEQLSFRCRERYICEDGYFKVLGDEKDDWYNLSFLVQYPPPKDDLITRAPNKPYLDLPLLNAPDPASQDLVIPLSFPPDPISRSWYLVTEEYSNRSFFNPTDNHAAFAGVVLRFQEAFRNHLQLQQGRPRYMAGLWETDMANGLLWMINPDLAAVPEQIQDDGTKKPVRRAPTWSWMALVGPIYQRCMRTWPELSIVRCAPKNSEEMKWGPAPEGWGPKMVVHEKFPLDFKLEVTAYICQVRISQYEFADYPGSFNNKDGFWTYQHIGYNEDLNPTPEMERHIFLLEAAKNPPLQKEHDESELDKSTTYTMIVGEGIFDRKDETSRTTEIWAMRVTTSHGLLLKRRGSTNVYERIGVFHIQSRRAFYPEGAVRAEPKDAEVPDYFLDIDELKIKSEEIVLV